MTTTQLPSFDLVIATVDRVDELATLLSSLTRQTHGAFRALVVDQNDDDRLEYVLRNYPSLELERLHSPRGLSRARNAALGRLRADIVAFPDDDCVFPDDLLERIARRFAAEPGLDGLTGRVTDAKGRVGSSWPQVPGSVTRDNLWSRAISFTIFLRTTAARRVGRFDEQLGLGSTAPWCSGEEIDYVIRALDSGAYVEYDPDIVVLHEHKSFSPRELSEAGAREGASIGYILRKHRYPLRTVGRMLIRPVGGALLSFARRDHARARFHLSTLRGRVRGYQVVGGSRGR